MSTAESTASVETKSTNRLSPSKSAVSAPRPPTLFLRFAVPLALSHSSRPGPATRTRLQWVRSNTATEEPRASRATASLRKEMGAPASVNSAPACAECGWGGDERARGAMDAWFESGGV